MQSVIITNVVATLRLRTMTKFDLRSAPVNWNDTKLTRLLADNKFNYFMKHDSLPESQDSVDIFGRKVTNLSFAYSHFEKKKSWDFFFFLCDSFVISRKKSFRRKKFPNSFSSEISHKTFFVSSLSLWTNKLECLRTARSVWHLLGNVRAYTFEYSTMVVLPFHNYKVRLKCLTV